MSADLRAQSEEVQKGLAHVTPIIMGLAKLSPVLKAVHGLHNYEGGLKRHTGMDPKEEEKEPDIRLDFIRPERKHPQGAGRGPGHIITKIGHQDGWDDAAHGRPIDSPIHRFHTDPRMDTPYLHRKKFRSKTQWKKRKPHL